MVRERARECQGERECEREGEREREREFEESIGIAAGQNKSVWERFPLFFYLMQKKYPKS